MDMLETVIILVFVPPVAASVGLLARRLIDWSERKGIDEED